MGVTLPQILQWLEQLDAVYAKEKDNLTALDAAIGDADHGVNMNRGFAAVRKSLQESPPQNIADCLRQAATTLIRTVGGASGPLYGTLFLRMVSLSEGKEVILGDLLLKMFETGVAGVQERGRSGEGDKTMLDVWIPSLRAYKTVWEEKGSLPEALSSAVEAARKGAKNTIDMVAKKGRASYLGERSKGHQDPGATSSLLMLECAEKLWGKE